MAPMRTILAVVLLAAIAAPAAAQPGLLENDALRFQVQNAERRAIDQSNQLMALEARQRADAAILDAQIQRNAVSLPELPYAPPSTSGVVATGKYPSMSDAALADSNRRVRAAAENHR